MNSSEQQQSSLHTLISAPDTSAGVAARARIVLLRAQGHTRGEVAKRCGVSMPTVDRWVTRFTEQGIAGLSERPRARAQVPDHVRQRLLELAHIPPPAETRLARWTTRTLADHLSCTDGVTVSNYYVATVLREAGVRLPAPPEQQTRRGRQPEPLDVRVEFVVVDGPSARALQQRQTEAIAAILRWLREHPDD
jgi:transposase